MVPSSLRRYQISQTVFTKRLLAKKTEKTAVIKMVEAYLEKQRGRVFSLPKKGSPVILLVSGGLDSMVMWYLLLKEFQYTVYPLFLDKGEQRYRNEYQAVKFFGDYFALRFPKYFKEPCKQSTLLPPKEIIEQLHTPYAEPNGEQKTGLEALTLNIFLGSPGVVPYYGMIYAQYLKAIKNINIRTIFSSVLPSDGVGCPSQSLTSIRLTNLAMCTYTNDYSWQYTSLALEKSLGLWLEKQDLVTIGQGAGLPLEKSWSCYNKYPQQCGTCVACKSRQQAFKNADVLDKTIYRSRSRARKLLGRLSGVELHWGIKKFFRDYLSH
jgi:7-cyano-7-deazaguanine synthase in queuosine biosynthesis